MRKLTCTISGSFNKHFDELQTIRRLLGKQGIDVLSPRGTRITRKEGDFLLLDTDRGTIREVELKHLRAITNSDFVYVVNPDGQVGIGASLEIGFAMARGIPVFSLQEIKDQVFAALIDRVPVSQVTRHLFSKGRSAISVYGLGQLQESVRTMIERKKFGRETISDLLVLLTEEVGELARVVRTISGLRSSRRTVNVDVALARELSDCMIYLLAIANLSRIDMGEALGTKIEEDLGRKWH